MYSWAWEANYKINDQPVHERVMASYYISAITSCTGISPIASYSPDSGLSKDSPDSIEFQFYKEINFCVLNSGHSHN